MVAKAPKNTLYFASQSFINQLLNSGNSPLLQDVYQQFLLIGKNDPAGTSGLVYIGAPGRGTFAQGQNITIDYSWLPNSGRQSFPPRFPTCKLIRLPRLAGTRVWEGIRGCA
jgi:hypothetical protein